MKLSQISKTSSNDILAPIKVLDSPSIKKSIVISEKNNVFSESKKQNKIHIQNISLIDDDISPEMSDALKHFFKNQETVLTKLKNHD